eukprot:CAMPEP_0172495230 /NCGR_PEP_ID=MMETSP1066-20121228/65033_1 /TAXON_ID=671091 /ORGANISM="Coscinodiscus wailesii, Strain CCMP2513" /LENGTH=256 /DNA_ID=CAMNT_0013266765 /DNA_START=70 /DNA_END=840 /DNA_ORIENTATION=-
MNSVIASSAFRRAWPMKKNDLKRMLNANRQQYSCFTSQSKATGHMALILGKPGGGKGTISGKILKDFPMFQHLSSGDILRHHVREETAVGMEAKKYMDEGTLVPDDVMIKLVVEDALKIIESGESLMLDGFPRTRDQASSLEESLNVDLVINLDIPTETIVERLSDRWIHAPSGRVYSYSYKPPQTEGIDDETGEALVQRDDDKPESIRKRLDLYDEATAPLIDFYSAKGVLETFKGTKSDVIYVSVKEWLDKKIA